MSLISNTSVRLAFTGDLALGGEFVRRAQPKNAPLTYPFAAITGTLNEADVVIVNLEGPIGMEGTPRAGRSALLHNEPEILDWLASFPNCVCCLANNHMMDYGADALMRTKRLLAERGIHLVGAGTNTEEADLALELNVRGFRISILAFTTDEVHVGSVLAGKTSPGSCALPDENTACGRVAALRKTSDAVVVLLHWGHEYFNYPTPSQMSLCRKLVAAGATIVTGHHPHVQQGYDRVGDGLICHSLGNLLLPEMRAASGRLQYRKPITKRYAILTADIHPHRVKDWNLSGGRCDRRYNLIPFSGAEAVRFEEEMETLSKPLQHSDYNRFWTSYQDERIRSLHREGIRDSLMKLLKTDFKTLWSTLSVKDVRRYLGRLGGTKTRACKVSPRGN